MKITIKAECSEGKCALIEQSQGEDLFIQNGQEIEIEISPNELIFVKESDIPA